MGLNLILQANIIDVFIYTGIYFILDDQLTPTACHLFIHL